MTHVITLACVDCKDGACVRCCPVDCIYAGARTLYIHPDECIDCGVCVSVCPEDAIYHEHDVPAHEAHYVAINREFFGPTVSALGSPGGASEAGVARCDHPAVCALAARG